MAKKIYKYFFHYNTASEGESFQRLLSTGNYEAGLCYWILLELVSRFETIENRGEIKIPVDLLARKWFMTRPKVKRILGQLSLNFHPNISSTYEQDLNNSSIEVVSIKLHNWLDFQELRGGKKFTKHTPNTGEKKKKKKKEKENDIKEANNISEMKKIEPEKKPASQAKRDERLAQVKDLFLSSYEKKFGHPYTGWGPKEYGQAANWLKSVGLPKALQLIPLFVEWKDSWVTKHGHTFGMLVAQSVKLESDFLRFHEKQKAVGQYEKAEKTVKEETANERGLRLARELRGKTSTGGSGAVREIPAQHQRQLPEKSNIMVDGEHDCPSSDQSPWDNP